ncbi:MAG: zinc-dependent metalloprotease [Planctomycetes bacterium]|nr:zinc-dependent metalloprotease [Planctomycetota bacterium]
MYKRLFVIGTFLMFAAVLLSPGLHAQKKDPPKDKDKEPAKVAPKDPMKEVKPVTPTKPGEPKPYDDVIPKTAKSYPGVFTVHKVDEKIFFEIPKDGFDKLMLWQAEVAKGPAGVTWGGYSLGSRYLRWDRRGNKVYLWQVSFAKRGTGTIQTAVDSANMDSIIMSFSVEAEGKDRSTVINATQLYLTDVMDLSVKGAVGSGGGIDPNRSYLESIKAFPTNIEARSLLTFTGGGGGGFGAFGKGASFGGGAKSYTAIVHYSLVMLPEKPMMGRFFDPRVGYFTRSFENYSTPKTWMETQQYITRFRLEKKDPTAAVSEPIKPIVFYVSREVPEKWKPYLLKGIEDWKPAFEKAGFKNAIIAKEAPDSRVDPNWDPEDARHSVIRWVADPFQNAMGPHVHDPRSGEIISAHIIFWHDVVKLAQQWYFVQCSAQDKRCKSLPLPDEVTGDILRYICAHEVGHTLGLRHNHRASSGYSIEQLRDPKFCEKHGSVASIMSYGRFNYVAQPEDNVKQLIPVIGPYDFFAIDWGYKGIAGAKKSEDERNTLDKWAARQIDEPWLRFGGEDGPASVDPTVKTENIGNDSIEATALGLKNLDRVLEKIVGATTAVGEDFALLEETYKTVLSHRGNWFRAVALNVGGVVESRTLGGRGTETFTRVSKDKQRQAVKFLNDNAFTTPTKMLNPAIVNQFRYTGVANDISGQQKGLMQSLLSSGRIRRLMDDELLQPEKAYTVTELVNEVQDGIFSELTASSPKVDVLRRGLQRAYLDHLKGELMPSKDGGPIFFGDGGGSTDFRAVARVSLQRLQGQVNAARNRTKDAISAAHLQDCEREIDVMLTYKK